MKKFVVFAIVSGLAASYAVAASGADLAPREYKAAPPVAAPVPLYDWSGFYVGGNVGGAWTDSASTNRALDGTFINSGPATTAA